MSAVDNVGRCVPGLSSVHITRVNGPSMGKVTIRPGFSGTVPIFNGVSRKKITVVPGRPSVPFLAWCPGFVPTLTNCAIYGRPA